MSKRDVQIRGSHHFVIKVGVIIFLCLFCLIREGYSQASPGPADAQKSKIHSDEDLLKATQNPVADLISLPIQYITNFNIGPYNRTEHVVSLQPVIPVKLSEDWLLVSRIIQPIAWQPYLDQDSGGTFGLGDMNPTFFLAPRNPGDVIWGIGPAMVIPTATDDILGSGKFSLGPSAVVLVQPGNWTLGALVSNVWSVAGSDNHPSVNRMSLQYFISYNLKDDWYLTSAPTLVADWRASGGDQWLVPVGGGLGKLVMFGTMPVDLSASFYFNVVKPDGGSNWQLNLQLTLLFPK
jgi:hypothetical protein